MKVKRKAISLVMLIIVTACLTFTFLIFSQDKVNLNAEIAQEVKSIRSIVDLLEKEKYQSYQLRIKTFVNDKTKPRQALLEAFAQRDRNALLIGSRPFLHFLKNENPYFSTLSWVTADNKNFLRVHRPEGPTGDDISKMRPDVVEANATYSQVTSYTVAKTGLQYRIVQPVHYRGRHIGAVQFGIDTMLLLDSIHEKLDMPVAMVLPNSKAVVATHAKAHAWTNPSHTLYSKQLDIFQLEDSSLDWTLETQRVERQGRSYQLVKVFDFLDYSKQPQGSLFVALDTTLREQKLFETLVLTTLISAAVLLFSFVVLYMNFSKLIGTIEGLNRKLQKQNIELETEVKERTASLQQSEEQLGQKYKMEAIGVMAGGIAHNFNNSLAIIIGNLEMAQRKFSHPEKVKRFIDNAKIATLRSRDLINQIMIYSRKGISRKDNVSLPAVIEEIHKLIRSTLPTTVNLSISLSQEVSECRINADPSRIQEALLNLCNNAVHAMDEKGDLKIGLKKVVLNHQDIPAQHQNCKPGTYVMLSVKDTGCGMDQSTISKIFDPFFTTKDIDKGTGMGLASVQGIIDQHSGLIKVHSAPGKGSTFELYFPTLNAAPATPRCDKEIPPQQGSEAILLVDDDQMIIDIGQEILSELGYKVTTATSGTDALAMIVDDPQRFQLIITDQTMPKMTGQELAQKIRQLNPDVPIILSTGYSSRVTEKDIVKREISAYCSKPLRLDELSQLVRTLLDKKAHPVQPTTASQSGGI